MKSRKKQQGGNGPSQKVRNPNSSHNDPAVQTMQRDIKIAKALKSPTMSTENREFLISVYGQARLSKKQLAKILRLCKMHSEQKNKQNTIPRFKTM